MQLQFASDWWQGFIQNEWLKTAIFTSIHAQSKAKVEENLQSAWLFMYNRFNAFSSTLILIFKHNFASEASVAYFTTTRNLPTLLRRKIHWSLTWEIYFIDHAIPVPVQIEAEEIPWNFSRRSLFSVKTRWKRRHVKQRF